MSTISKIYISNVKEWTQFRNWCIRNRKKCWNRTHIDILGYFYSNSESEVTDWLANAYEENVDRLMRIYDISTDKTSNEYLRNFYYWETTPNSEFGSSEWWDTAIFDEEYYNKIMQQYDRFFTDGYIDYSIPMVNLPIKVDKWLVRHCPIPIIRKRLGEQGYNVYSNKTKFYK